MIKKAIYITIFLLFGITKAYFSMSENCTIKDHKKVKLLTTENKQLVDMDLEAALKKSRHLGKGQYGVVKAVNWLYLSDAEVAVKEVIIEEPDSALKLYLLRNEFEAMFKMNSSGSSPKFYGCIMKNNVYYIIQEILGDNLSDRKTKELFQNVPYKKSFPYFYGLFKGLSQMDKLELVHNDIKPENLMMTPDNSRIVLIDFGFAAKRTDQVKQITGTPYFISPNKRIVLGRGPDKIINNRRFKGDKIYNPVNSKDDAYALALSIAVILSNPNEVFLKHEEYAKKTTYTNLPDSCYLEIRTGSCKNVIVKNVKEIFKNAKYGTYDEDATKDNMNLTTLLTKIIDFDAIQTMTYDDIMDILDRLITKIIPEKIEVKEQKPILQKKLSIFGEDKAAGNKKVDLLNDMMKMDALFDQKQPALVNKNSVPRSNTNDFKKENIDYSNQQDRLNIMQKLEHQNPLIGKNNDLQTADIQSKINHARHHTTDEFVPSDYKKLINDDLNKYPETKVNPTYPKYGDYEYNKIDTYQNKAVVNQGIHNLNNILDTHNYQANNKYTPLYGPQIDLKQYEPATNPLLRKENPETKPYYPTSYQHTNIPLPVDKESNNTYDLYNNRGFEQNYGRNYDNRQPLKAFELDTKNYHIADPLNLYKPVEQRGYIPLEPIRIYSKPNPISQYMYLQNEYRPALYTGIGQYNHRIII